MLYIFIHIYKFGHGISPCLYNILFFFLLKEEGGFVVTSECRDHFTGMICNVGKENKSAWWQILMGFKNLLHQYNTSIRCHQFIKKRCHELHCCLAHGSRYCLLWYMNLLILSLKEKLMTRIGCVLLKMHNYPFTINTCRIFLTQPSREKGLWIRRRNQEHWRFGF